MRAAVSSAPVDLLAASREPNLRAMLLWLGNLHGKRVLDLCCGTGTTTLLLGEAGAEEVIGCDISESSLALAARRSADAGATDRLSFVHHDAQVLRPDWAGGFDILFGSWALHHLDLDRCLPVLATYLRPGARSVFSETSAINPILRWSRRWLPGRMGIPRYGTSDERPLSSADLQAIGNHLGGCRVMLGNYTFLHLLDRQVFHYRSPRLSRACAAGDELLRRVYPSGSYHIVLACGPLTGGR